MCTTKQYVFACGHVATKQFFTDICPRRGGDCQPQHHHCHLTNDCHACEKLSLMRSGQSKRKNARKRTHDEFADNDDIWVIPSRCFVDVGFNLDPFGVNNSNDRTETTNRTTTDAEMEDGWETEGDSDSNSGDKSTLTASNSDMASSSTSKGMDDGTTDTRASSAETSTQDPFQYSGCTPRIATCCQMTTWINLQSASPALGQRRRGAVVECFCTSDF